jgi:hypothetical protein
MLLCLSVHRATSPDLSAEDKAGAYSLTTQSGEKHQFAGIADVASEARTPDGLQGRPSAHPFALSTYKEQSDGHTRPTAQLFRRRFSRPHICSHAAPGTRTAALVEELRSDGKDILSVTDLMKRQVTAEPTEDPR